VVRPACGSRDDDDDDDDDDDAVAGSMIRLAESRGWIKATSSILGRAELRYARSRVRAERSNDDRNRDNELGTILFIALALTLALTLARSSVSENLRFLPPLARSLFAWFLPSHPVPRPEVTEIVERRESWESRLGKFHLAKCTSEFRLLARAFA